jgi:hypothetical protein
MCGCNLVTSRLLVATGAAAPAAWRSSPPCGGVILGRVLSEGLFHSSARPIPCGREQSAPGCCSAATLNNYRRVIPASRSIQPFCDLRATAIVAVTRYGAAGSKQRAPAMMAYVASEGRLFGLTPTDWAVLLVGMMLCGVLTPLFLT